MIKVKTISYNDLALCHYSDPATVFVIKNFLLKSEVEKVLWFGKSIISNTISFEYQDLTSVDISVRRDVRPKGQMVKGISENIFIKPNFVLEDEIAQIYIKCANLRRKCLNQYSDMTPEFFMTPEFLNGSLEAVKDLGVPMLDIRHYPKVSGHLDPHTDPPSNQGLVGMVFLYNSHLSQTGLYFQLSGSKYYLDGFLKPGDAYIFSPDVTHGVDNTMGKIYDMENIDWDLGEGRWAVFCPWLSPS